MVHQLYIAPQKVYKTNIKLRFLGNRSPPRMLASIIDSENHRESLMSQKNNRNFRNYCENDDDDDDYSDEESS